MNTIFIPFDFQVDYGQTNPNAKDFIKNKPAPVVVPTPTDPANATTTGDFADSLLTKNYVDSSIAAAGISFFKFKRLLYNGSLVEYSIVDVGTPNSLDADFIRNGLVPSPDPNEKGKVILYANVADIDLVRVNPEGTDYDVRQTFHNIDNGETFYDKSDGQEYYFINGFFDAFGASVDFSLYRKSADQDIIDATKLSAVAHDTTLTGNGTAGSPLHVDISESLPTYPTDISKRYALVVSANTQTLVWEEVV
jgi:hypothetical protein